MVTLTATAFEARFVPSETLTTISYTLLPPASAGASKFGLALKVTAPVVALMLNRFASVPVKK